MIEQSIYFALGCLVTALLALAFAPVFWSRALRLTRRRLQLQIPLSMQEILADRDQLRAQFAVERVRVEQALERVQATKAHDLAEIGRRTMEAVGLNERLAAARDLEQVQDREIARLNRDAAETETENGALRVAHFQSETVREDLRQRHATATDEIARLADEAQRDRATIASLETRAMGLEMRLTDMARAQAAQDKRNEAALRSRLEAAMSQASRHETSALSFERERDDAKAHARALEQELETVREREKSSHLQRSLQSEKARGQDRTHAERVDQLQTENAALREALAEARRSEPGPTSDDDADGGLRASIHALGLAVAVMSRGDKGRERGDAPAGQDGDVPT